MTCRQGIQVAMLLISAALLRGTQITIINSGFETPVTSAGNFSTSSAPSGWSTYGSVDFSSRAVGVLNPSGTTLYGSTPEGSNVGVVFLLNSGGGNTYANSPAGLQQTLSDNLAGNTRYTLSVAVGNIANDSTYPHSDFNFTGFPGFRIELLAGGSVVASLENTVTPAEGTFSTVTLNYDVGGAHSSIGSVLGIRLINLDAAPGIEVNFDNVSLTATAIPEPAHTVTGAATAALLLLSLRRRRNTPFPTNTPR